MYAEYQHEYRKLILHEDFNAFCRLVPVTVKHQHLAMSLANMDKHIDRDRQIRILQIAHHWLSQPNVFVSDRLLKNEQEYIKGHYINIGNPNSRDVGFRDSFSGLEFFINSLNVDIGVCHWMGTYSKTPTGMVTRRHRQEIIDPLLLDL